MAVKWLGFGASFGHTLGGHEDRQLSPHCRIERCQVLVARRRAQTILLLAARI